ncbi:hypothetical protein SAMN06269185_1691 [Natronoarchaeum philippinense]|uniref:Uncharacterized protein n=1 Tax=Natronoarchaeum philippinense TaxID=558529 RepID=A0A285NSD5_NATPI|nr:DUF6663 family protein [Natronoarchaeum philippinense]SNZ12395.1 hypothetical protein SAMN06269185_1691 [Natronoarchaeum philippinense]
MQQTSDGRFRVLSGRSDDEWLLLDVESAEPTYVPTASAPDLAVGNRIEASLRWADGDPSVDDYSMLSPTSFQFARTDEAVFQAAQECFEAARSAGEAMNSRVTYSTDNEPNGVVYTFAEQSGQRDLFTEFRDGVKPLDPLVARAAEDATPPFSVWILDPREPFVLVYIVLDPDGILEETMRDTYKNRGSQPTSPD